MGLRLMDPAIENQDFRPPPQPGPPRGLLLLLVIMIHAGLIAALQWELQWRRGPAEEATVAQTEQIPAEAKPPSTTVAQESPAAEPAHTPCPLRPLLAAALGGRDGQLFPPAEVADKTEQDIDAMLVAGKEAAAAGRVRDAEVAYLTSCRVADALKGAGSLESANARYQLARHYVAAANAASAAPVAERAEVFGRAQAYYEDSLRRFRAEWGDSHEKTQFAEQGLEATRVALAQAAEPAGGSQAAATAQMGAGPASPEPVQERPSAPERPRPAAPSVGPRSKSGHVQNTVASPAPRAAASPQPSFDCRKARSYAERTICADAQLAQLDRDLGRLHARAKQAAVSPAAFKRQNDAEWRRREKTCRDRACLLRWYAERRQQLMNYLSQPARADRTAAR